MLTIDELKNIDHQILKEFEDSLNLFPTLIESEFKYTAEICFMYMNNSDFIKDSILDLVERENYYSINILHRSLIEHFLRFNYFFFNFAINGKSDKYANKFRTSLLFTDKLSIRKSHNSGKRIKNLQSDTLKNIQDEIYTSSADFQQFDLDELLKFSNELSIKNIINFIENHIGKQHYVPNDFLIDTLVRYSKQSSYVHGGIFSNQELRNFAIKNEENKIKNLTVIYGLSLQTATFIKIYSYIILTEINPEFFKYYSKITSEIIKMTPNFNWK